MRIPFTRPYIGEKAFAHIAAALEHRHLAGDGPFTARCAEWLQTRTGAPRALLTHSGTGALEMAAHLSNVQAGDEVILPSFTFVSTANAFVLRGATPVFIDIRADTLNLDERLIESALTPRTKVIVPVHYAGVSCDMDAIGAIADRHGVLVVEDAAQGVMATYRGRALGTMGQLGALSFHETKNLTSGEGGALLVNDVRLAHRAEIIREKGTNRSAFFRGEVDKYTWTDLGSSWLPSDVLAALLWSQFQAAEEITSERHAIWNRYHEAFADAESTGMLRRPVVPPECHHSAHLYYLLLPSLEHRTNFIEALKRHGIQAPFHFVPLHSAPMGLKVARVAGSMPQTDDVSNRLVRLPLWPGIQEVQEEIIERVLEAVSH